MRPRHYRIVKVWSDKLAGWTYHLQYVISGSNYWISSEEGNREWAKRIASHYNIKVPSKPLVAGEE